VRFLFHVYLSFFWCCFMNLKGIYLFHTLMRGFNGVQLFMDNILCGKNISFKNTVLNQWICIDYDIVTNLCISSPNYIRKQRNWEDERSIDFKLVFFILMVNFLYLIRCSFPVPKKKKTPTVSEHCQIMQLSWPGVKVVTNCMDPLSK